MALSRVSPHSLSVRHNRQLLLLILERLTFNCNTSQFQDMAGFVTW